MRLFLSDLRALSPEAATRMIEALPPKRRDTVLRCCEPSARNAKAAGYHLVRYAAAQLGVELPLADFEIGKNGKPYFPDHPVHFNLSHTAHCVAVAVSKAHPVGVDIEEIRPLREGFGTRWFSDAERALLARAQDKEEELIRLWTAKEAAAKWVGRGLDYNLSNIDISNAVSACFSLGEMRLALSLCPARELPALSFVLPESLPI